MAVFQVIQIIYWLALSTWFGGVLFVAVVAPIIFRTVEENHPVLPHVLSVNLEGQHSTLLGGAIVGQILQALGRIELTCSAVMLLTLIAQCFIIDLTNRWNFIAALLRISLYLLATTLVIYDWRVLGPRIWKYRQEFIDHADEPETANPAKEQFDRYHHESVTLLSILLLCLLGIVVFSAGISERTGSQTVTIFGSHSNVTTPGQ
jgi:hypothetical protein